VSWPTRRAAPGSVKWTIDREAALLLGAGRALLLQIAHPRVAAGVAEHSRFACDPWGRLRRTLGTTYALVFGDESAAAAARSRLEAIHRRVRGVLREESGPWAAGTPYDAADAALRLWVHATLVDTSLLVYDRFVRRLGPGEQAAYYADSRELGLALGIPDAVLPTTIHAFRSYVAETLARDVAVGATARTLARQIFRPPGAVSAAVVGGAARFVTVGLLPPPLREQFGYRWTPARERTLDTLARAVRTMLPALPAVIRHVPEARAAEQRLRRRAETA
jgi:uncharacterized protein (DUF2236 family)